MYKKVLYGLGGVCVVGLLYFAYYAVSPLFTVVKMDESLPGEVISVSPELVKTDPIEQKRAAIVDTLLHPASGFVRLVETEEGKFIRYEDYKTINGPDIYVYLAKDLDAKEFVDLGKVKATEGNINYQVPEGVDLAQYPYVLTWCKAFGVLFNHADISALLSKE